MIETVEASCNVRMKRLRKRYGKPFSCFLLTNSRYVGGTLAMFVKHTREQVLEAIKVADDWYVRYNMNYYTYLHLRRDLFRLLREL